MFVTAYPSFFPFLLSAITKSEESNESFYTYLFLSRGECGSSYGREGQGEAGRLAARGRQEPVSN